MFTVVKNWLWQHVIDWLNAEPQRNQHDTQHEVYDFEQLLSDIRPADVILFEGHTRVSEVVKLVTLSPWTHVALYIGQLHDIKDPTSRHIIKQFYQGSAFEPLIIESLLGYGTILTPLKHYRYEHLRICRASNLHHTDREKMIPFALEHLGLDYDVRQLLDLARLVFPYGIIPRRWRSTLFQHNAGKPTHIVCSSLIARCFQHVHYPILPIIRTHQHDRVRFYKRNFRLFVPADFDYSPFFDIKKYPSKCFINRFSAESHPTESLPATDNVISATPHLCLSSFVQHPINKWSTSLRRQ